MDTETVKLGVRLQRKPCQAGPARQAGSIVVVTVLSLVVLVGMVGYVADVGHLFVDKTRLQNGLDAAALSAAMTLSASQDCSKAVAAGNSTLAQMQATNKDLEKIANRTWTFANTLSTNSANWIASGASNCNDIAHFARVSADLPGLTVFFLQVLEFVQSPKFNITKETSAAAVAGPNSCPSNIIPVGACATDGAGGTAVPHLTCATNDPDCYGYQIKKEYCIKPGAAASGNGNNTDWSCGAGDLSGWFNWLALSGPGANNLAFQLKYDPSVSGDNCPSQFQPLDLEAGNIASSKVRDNFNHRLDPKDLDSSISDAKTRRKLANCWRGDLGFCDPASSGTGQKCNPAATPSNQLTLDGTNPNADNCVWDEAQLKDSPFNQLSFVDNTTENPADNPADAGGIVNNVDQKAQVLQYSTNGPPPGTGWGKSLYDGYAAAWPNGAKPLNEHTSPRIVVIPVLDCSNAMNTSATPPLIGYMCGFITRQIPKSGGVGVENRIAMEFTRGCGNTPRTPIKIVLYKDPFRRDA